MADRPKVLVFGGPNGAGKSTLAPRQLRLLGIEHFANADEIARGLNPANPEAAAVEAGRQMLRQMRELRDLRASFAFESTLASRSFARFLKLCGESGYEVWLTYVWVPSPDVSVSRVAKRVLAGGHNVPEPDVRRRWKRSALNLFSLYIPLADFWRVWVNKEVVGHQLVAGGIRQATEFVVDDATWHALNHAAETDGDEEETV